MAYPMNNYDLSSFSEISDSTKQAKLKFAEHLVRQAAQIVSEVRGEESSLGWILEDVGQMIAECDLDDEALPVECFE